MCLLNCVNQKGIVIGADWRNNSQSLCTSESSDSYCLQHLVKSDTGNSAEGRDKTFIPLSAKIICNVHYKEFIILLPLSTLT